jgi:hypothetical protein
LKTSQTLQLISHFALIAFLGFPLILMMVKTLAWEKRQGGDYRLRIHQVLFFSMLLLSANLMGRLEFIAAYLFFVLPSSWVIFTYQVSLHEPGFRLREAVKSQKKWLVIPLTGLLIMAGLYPMIPRALVEEQIAMTRALSQGDPGEESYNLYRIRQWFGENPDDPANFDQDRLTVAQKGMTLIVLQYRQGDRVVDFLYGLEANRWRLQGIHDVWDPHDKILEP